MKQGLAIQVYGRYFAGIMHMRMERSYKIINDYVGEPFKVRMVSPFSIMGEPDAALQKYVDCERTNPRVKADIGKNFGEICRKAHCDWFVLDNSAALMGLVQINEQIYSCVKGEETDFADDYFNDSYLARGSYISPLDEKFSGILQEKYDMFIDAVLRFYPPERIILIRSHVPCFRLYKGKVVKTLHTKKARALLTKLDNYFADKVNCVCLDTVERFFEDRANHRDYIFEESPKDLRVALERAIILEIENPTARRGARGNVDFTPISEYIADGGSDLTVIADYFKHRDYTYDDIAALSYLRERLGGAADFTGIISSVLSRKDGDAYIRTKELFDRNINKLRSYEYCMADIDSFLFDGRIIIRLGAEYFLEINQNAINPFNIAEPEWNYKSFIEAGYTCNISGLERGLSSWETYFERGRQNCTAPFILRFETHDEFERSLYFVDYEDILDNEHYVITLPDSDIKNIKYRPKVDASFLFDESTRIVTIYNGLGDQAEIYLVFQKMADDYGLNVYFDDAYTYNN